MGTGLVPILRLKIGKNLFSVAQYHISWLTS